MKFFPFVLVCFVHNYAECANILGLFYSPSRSHHILGSTLLKTLAKKGHNVTMISPYPLTSPIPNYTDIELEGLQQLSKELTDKLTRQLTNSDMDVDMLNYVFNILDAVLSQKVTKDFLETNAKFDVIIQDYPGSEVLLGFSHRHKTPIILFSPFGYMEVLSLIAEKLRASPNNYNNQIELPLHKKLKNIVNYWTTSSVNNRKYESLQEVLLRKHFPEVLSYDEVLDNVALIFINSHHVTENPRSYAPNMIQVGGFYLQDVEPIPAGLKDFLDEATEGVIYFSFGSKITRFAFSSEKLEIFINSFSKLKQKVLWKFDKEELPRIPANVRVESWVPQKEVLDHPNVKVFITHAGFGGVTESIYGGVPMIGMPFYFDQIQHIAHVVERGYGVQLNFHNLTDYELMNAINEVFNNTTYSENVKLASSLFRNQPMPPMDNAIYWVEYVAKYKGANHLRTIETTTHFYYQEMDVVIFMAAVFASLILFASFILNKFIKYSWNRMIKTPKVKFY